MTKRIPLHQLEPGMFVCSFDLSWFKHPFVSTRLGVIRDRSLIEELRRLGVTHVDVDPSLAVAQEKPAPDKPDPPPETQPTKPARAGLPSCPPASDPLRTARFAKKLFDHAMGITRNLMLRVSLGETVPVEDLNDLAGVLVDTVGRNEHVVHLLLSLKSYDDYTYTHSLNLGALSVMLGSAMELPKQRLEHLGMAGILHDVGKALLPRELVFKPGQLTLEEFELMKRHPALGHAHLAREGELPEPVLRAVLQHHERIDGTGYPDGLRGESIDILSSIVSVVDIYDALTSDRVYRSRVSPHTALRVLYGLRGEAFPDCVVDVFIKRLGVYPALSVVQLRNGCYAWVTRQTPGQPLFPEVAIFRDRERRPVATRRVDTWRLCGELSRKEFEIVRPVEPGEVETPPAACGLG